MPFLEAQEHFGGGFGCMVGVHFWFVVFGFGLRTARAFPIATAVASLAARIDAGSRKITQRFGSCGHDSGQSPQRNILSDSGTP
jgi:hypothetical protein